MIFWIVTNFGPIQVIDERTVLVSVDSPPNSEFASCSKGEKVNVVRELPDGTVVILKKVCCRFVLCLL